MSLLVTCVRFIRRALYLLFILALVVLPGPLAVLLSSIVLKPERRNVPAQVLRKGQSA